MHLFGLKLHPRVHLSLELLCLLLRSLRLDSQRFEPSLGCIVLLCGVFNRLVLLFFSFQLSSERGRLVCRGICSCAKCPHLVPEMAEEHKRALGEESAKVYRVVRNDLRALRRRYFVRMGKDTSGAEIDVEDCDEDNDGVDMGRARKRLGIEGLVSAMMDFKRRGEVDADAFGDMGLRKELRRMEECLLLALTGDLENGANEEIEEIQAWWLQGVSLRGRWALRLAVFC